MKQKLGVDFSSTKAKKKSTYIVRFKQIFYTVSAERPAKPADVFSTSATWEDIGRAGVSEKHPPLFVKNVQYGRQIFLKFDSDLSSTDLEATVKGTITAGGVKVEGKASTDYNEKLSKINVSMVALGGSAKEFKDLKLNSLEDVKEINKIIVQKTQLSRDNPAAALNYYTVFLKDGAPGIVSGKTDYISEKTEVLNGGELHLKNDGAYNVEFFVHWDEISYQNGSKMIKRDGWEGSGARRCAGYSTVITFKGNVRNIEIIALRDTGAGWMVSGNKIGLPLVSVRTVTTGGTTFGPTFTMEPPE